jgi:very-short-patch-repair endonuclease
MVLPSASVSAAAADVNHISSPDAKITLFRSLFRGRDDIYPPRFESRKTGKFDRRCNGYQAVGYTIQLPGSTVPGWPAEVSLPVDPEWKSQYAASVRRLVRDGVDPPLANLFVHVAKTTDPIAEGANRAQSAKEAFLFRRLETLPEMAGLFRLNIELPIAFDGWGKMEVDLLATQTRVAIELDGGQHLDDADTYRRDRRKDIRLQENGYLVLRFLAEDVGKRLDAVLHAILRALSHRNAKI